MRDKIPSGAEHILRTLTGAGHEAWLVGGCVRDLLRGSLPHDWDICTSARPEETEACFAGETIIETGLKELAVNGRDVIAAGIASGPAMGQALAGLLERVLNGEVPNEREVLLRLLDRAVSGGEPLPADAQGSHEYKDGS